MDKTVDSLGEKLNKINKATILAKSKKEHNNRMWLDRIRTNDLEASKKILNRIFRLMTKNLKEILGIVAAQGKTSWSYNDIVIDPSKFCGASQYILSTIKGELISIKEMENFCKNNNLSFSLEYLSLKNDHVRLLVTISWTKEVM